MGLARRVNVILYATAVVAPIRRAIARTRFAQGPGVAGTPGADAPFLERAAAAPAGDAGAPRALMAVPAVLPSTPLMRRRKATEGTVG